MRAANLVKRGYQSIYSNIHRRGQLRLLSSVVGETDAVVREKMFYDAVIVGAGTELTHIEHE